MTEESRKAHERTLKRYPKLMDRLREIEVKDTEAGR
jgi:hypothetical protein